MRTGRRAPGRGAHAGSARAALPQVALLGGTVALVAGLALLPVGYLLWRTVIVDGSPSLELFRRAYGTFGLGSMAGNSLLFATGSTVLAVGLGTALAFAIVRTDIPCRGIFFVAALLPLIMPGILHTVAWIFLAGPRSGALNRALEPLFGPATIDVFSLGGMVLVEGLALTPLVFLLMAAAFRSMDPALEESALVSGARLRSVLRHVTLPVVRPALLAGALVAMVRSLEAFETPAIIGIPAGTWVFTSRIWRALSRYPADFGQAGAYSVSLLVLTVAGVFAYSRVTGSSRRFHTITGRGRSPRPLRLGRWRTPATFLVAGYVVVAVVLPLVILVYASTQPFYEAPSLKGLSRMTLSHYVRVLSDPRLVRAARNSMVLAVAAATVVMLVAAIAGWLVVRTRARGRWLLDAIGTLPIAVPGLVLGVALLTALLRSPVPVYGTLWILLIAYVVRALPYGIRYASTGMFQVATELEDAASVSGATWWQAFRRILVPLVRPSLLAGWLYIVVISVRELSTSLLLYSPRTEVLSIRLWTHYEDGALPEMAALGVVMIVGLGALAAAAYRLGLVAEAVDQ